MVLNKARKLFCQEPEIFPIDEIHPDLEGSYIICKELYLKSGYVDLVYINDNAITTLVFFISLNGKEELKTALIKMLECADELVKGRYFDFLSNVSFNFERNPFYKYGNDDIRSYENINPLGEREFSVLIISDGIDEELIQFKDYIRPYCNRKFNVTLLHALDAKYGIDFDKKCSISSNEI